MTLLRRFRAWQVRARDPALTVLLIVQLIAIFLVAPVAAMGLRVPPLVLDLLLIAVIGLVLVLSASRVAVALAAFAIVVSFVGAFLRITQPSTLTELLGHGGTMLGFATLAWVVAQAVFAGGRVTMHRVQGAIVLYLNFAIIFSAAYRLVLDLWPGAFHGVTAALVLDLAGQRTILATMLYFSFTTLTSTGFGDIVPVHPLARSLANLEAIVGQLYPATLLARVVMLELQFRRAPGDRP